MPGTPIKEKLLADIEAQGGWDAVCERVASGENQTAVALSFGVSQGFFSRIMHLDENRVRAYRAAKRESAHVMAEKAMELADNVPEKRDAIAKVREQIGVRRWLAASYNREEYGESGDTVNVQVNVAELHLDALRHRQVTPPEHPPALPVDGVAVLTALRQLPEPNTPPADA